MSFFQPVPIPAIVHPASFPGIYSQDDYVNDMAQRAANDYTLAHARVQALERHDQCDHFHRHSHHRHYHHRHSHHHHQHHPGAYRGYFVPASLDNFSYGFAPACARPILYAPHRRPAAYSPEQVAYRIYQEEERRRALNRQHEAITRQQELAREREAQRRRAVVEAAAREEQAHAARAARIRARQARDQEVLLSLLGQLGLAVAPAQSAQAQVNREQPSTLEQQASAARAARTQARQARGQELLMALLGQMGLAVDPAQSAPAQVDREKPPVQFTHAAAPTTAAFTSPPVPVDRKGKSKAVDVPAEIPTPSPDPIPVPVKVPTLKEELEARIRSETDPQVQESLVLLYSDIFDARHPGQPVAGPSGHKHDTFEIPVTGPSSSTTTSPVPVKTEEQVDITTAPVSAKEPETNEKKVEEDNGASLHRTSLAQITDVEEALQKLEGAFEFPARLDFVDRPPSPSPSLSASPSDKDTESALAYTPNNIPIHAYEHALSDLLTRLDAVESNGDLEVRGRRREVVKEVERALEAIERRIEESRERSRERTRRGSVSSQVSDASVTVTPYDVHSSDKVDKVEVAAATEEVAIAAEEVPVAAEDEVLVEVEESKTTPPQVEDTSIIAEDAPAQAEVSEPAVATPVPDVASASPSVNSVEPEYTHLAAGIPDGGADIYAQSPSDQLIQEDPSSPIDDVEDLDGTLTSSSQAPGDVHSSVDEVAVPSSDGANEVVEKDPADAEAAGVDVQPQGLTTAPTLESEVAVTSPVEPSEETNSASPTPLAAPEPISRIESSATDTTFIAAEANSVPPSAADDDATFFTTGNTTPSESEPSPTPPPASTPPSDSESASSAGEETFVLSSTPLADEQPEKPRRSSTSSGEDELEIIGKEELEVARNDSDWSDVESESDADLEVVL